MLDNLPHILAGPLLRHVSTTEVTFWLATSSSLDCRLQLFNEDNVLYEQLLTPEQHQRIPVGQHCFINLIHVQLEHSLPQDSYIEYELLLGDKPKPLNELLVDLCFEGETRPGFMLKSRVDNLLHGSCRKPHYPSADGLVEVDKVLCKSFKDPVKRPAMLMLSGDQVYIDDIAGPSLVAIHKLSKVLGLWDEQFEGATVGDTSALHCHQHCYYAREQLLPKTKANEALLERFFIGAKKPIFTTACAHNHLISFAEVIAMYLLVWSPTCWQLVDMEMPLDQVPEKQKKRYFQERQTIESFVSGLGQVRRAMAHLQCYMIFDDHDVTDDWNLTRGWEESAYSNTFSRRIIGNALVGYWLCQGWGNQPIHFEQLNDTVDDHFSSNGIDAHDQLVDRVLNWQHWHYHLDTLPKIIVLDTRTHRWRSEESPNRPSGLMDWESLSETQQLMLNEPAVILVSSAPMFGVKLIEVVQKVFAFFGKALLVDAENWMSHKGSAEVMLNIFRHPKTPPRFVILSGDVHYSFFYDITLRFKKNSPQIFQITASGIKNQFPKTLLNVFDAVNRWLFGVASPLNFFTRRRTMLINRRKPKANSTRVLHNCSGIGQVELSEDCTDVRAKIMSESETVEFR